MERSVVVPDRTFAFKNLVGSAVIGKTVDLETLVDFDKLLRIARVGFSSIQYLGGLFILISFPDAPAASSFVDDRKIWGPWFDKLEIWSGQMLPPERVAWLKLHGIPLNLMEADVFMQIGDLFGKVLFVPKFLDDDKDLSVVKIGVLVGNAHRNYEVVSLRWKDKVFRVRVDEDLEDWVPDCLDFEDQVGSESESPAVSSPVAAHVTSGVEGFEEVQKSDGQEKSGRSHHYDGMQNEVTSPVHVHEVNSPGQPSFVAAVGPSVIQENVGPSPNKVDPNVLGGSGGPPSFGLGLASGPLKSKPKRRSVLGSRLRKGKAQGGNSCSPGCHRPMKRSRRETEEEEVGLV
ncbi:hypothetical protein HanPI659440_Chr17g0678741 [Helianthus annuus]|nr:hypothetical protein HanPI659440_Chr17g0678741 [Helianthus annuus]